MDSARHVNTDPRRALPSVDRLSERVLEQNPELPPWAATEGARRVLVDARAKLSRDANSDSMSAAELTHDALAAAAARIADALRGVRPRRVINATGVVLHTNLGRSPLAPGAAAAAAEAASGYSDLELDLATGRRGNRLGALSDKLCLLSGAEAAYACNNNAAAVLLVLNTLAAGREVIVSRGELVEIGGSFRVPEIMRRAGVRLVEVGSTNRTHPKDYVEAIGPDTAMLLKVHRSNFEVRGFVAEVDLATLVAIGQEHSVPVVEDLGSGTLLDLSDRGFPSESFAPGRLRDGPDLVCFSGDKLLGGPQAGIVLGRTAAIDAIRTNPLARALRLDKMTLAALEWTLSSMLDGSAETEIPVLRQLLLSSEEHERVTRAFAKRLGEGFGSMQSPPSVEVARERVPVGGGSLPGFELDSWVVAIRPPQAADARSAEAIQARLRSAPTPVIARVRDDAVLIDLRTLDAAQHATLFDALIAALH
jgi:L-seryl-tRNA(Ser) seleniumtransferase